MKTRDRDSREGFTMATALLILLTIILTKLVDDLFDDLAAWLRRH